MNLDGWDSLLPDGNSYTSIQYGQVGLRFFIYRYWITVQKIPSKPWSRNGSPRGHIFPPLWFCNVAQKTYEKLLLPDRVLEKDSQFKVPCVSPYNKWIMTHLDHCRSLLPTIDSEEELQNLFQDWCQNSSGSVWLLLGVLAGIPMSRYYRWYRCRTTTISSMIQFSNL